MMNEGSSSNSISATSGAPDPAFIALFSSVYSAPPAPGSSSVTQIDGWVLLNSVTARLIPGTQAQNVTGVADELQDLPPARRDALALALAVDPDDEDDEDELLPLLLQAASTKMAAVPAAAAVILRVFDNILARLLCSVLPYVCAVAAVLAACGGGAVLAACGVGPPVVRRAFGGD